MAKKVILSVGTKRGLFLLESGTARRKWKVTGPLLKGWQVPHAVIDTRGTPRLHVAASSYTYAPTTLSATLGKLDLKPAERPPAFPKLNAKAAKFVKQYGIDASNRIWNITPGPRKQAKVLYCGTAPAGLFRSENGGRSWEPVKALNEHRSRKDWNPGAGGQALHSIEFDAQDENRIYAAISAAGAFRSDDGGQQWTPINRAVSSYVGAPKDSEVGSCVHALRAHREAPGVAYQQNHVGVYRTRDHGDTWERIDEGLPHDFGFGLALHPRDPSTCYVLPLQPEEYMFRATGGSLDVYRFARGGEWRKLGKGLPRKDAYVSVLRQAMSSDSCDPCGVYFGTQGGQVFASRDEGASWELAAAYLPSIHSVTAAVVE